MRKKKHFKEKKKNNKFIIFGIIIILIIISSVVFVNVKKNKNPTKQKDEKYENGISLYNTSIGEDIKEAENGVKINTGEKINTDKILDNFTISEIQLTYNSGITSITAKVTNNSNEETELTTITAILVGEENKELCKVKGVVRALGVGETGILNISMSGNYITAKDIKFSKK